MRIYHIADVHIVQRTIENLKHAFKVLFDNIRNYPGKSILVIAGDLFDVKGRISIDELQFFNKYIATFDHCPVIIIPGNHDMNPNRSSDSANSVSVVCEHLSFFVVSVPTVIRVENVDFYCYPNSTEVSALAAELAVADPAFKKFAVVHEAIEGSVSHGSKRKLKEYDAFDVVLLGDIHKRQFLGAGRRAAYPGSFTQVKIDEGIDHGYLMWDSETLDVEYVQIPMKTLDIQIILDSDMVVVPPPDLLPGQTVRRCNVRHSRCSTEFVDQCRKIYSNYGNIEFHDTTKIRDIEVSTSSGGAFDFDLSQIIEKVAPDRIDSLQRMLKHYLPMVGSAERSLLKIMYMKWDNLYCYGENNYINFEDMGLLTGVYGNNGVGKSSIAKIMMMGLYRKSGKNSLCSTVKKNTESGSVVMHIMSGNENVVIKTDIQSTGGNGKTQIFVKSNDISGSTAVDTKQVLKLMNGASDVFGIVNYAADQKSISQISDSKYKKALLELFGLGDVKDAVASAKTDKTSLTKEQNILRGRIDQCESNIKSTACSDVVEISYSMEAVDRDLEIVISKLESIPKDKYGLSYISIPNSISPMENTMNIPDEVLLKLQNYKPPNVLPSKIRYYKDQPLTLPKKDYNPEFDGISLHELTDSKSRFISCEDFKIQPEYPEFTDELKLELKNLMKMDLVNVINPDTIPIPEPPTYHKVKNLNAVPHPGKEPAPPVLPMPVAPIKPIMNRPSIEPIPCEEPTAILLPRPDPFKLIPALDDPSFLNRPAYREELEIITPMPIFMSKPDSTGIPLHITYRADLEAELKEPTLEQLEDLIEPIRPQISRPIPHEQPIPVERSVEIDEPNYIHCLEVEPIKPESVEEPTKKDLADIISDSDIEEIQRNIAGRNIINKLKFDCDFCDCCSHNLEIANAINSSANNEDRLIQHQKAITKVRAYEVYIKELSEYNNKLFEYRAYHTHKQQYSSWIKYKEYVMDCQLYEYQQRHNEYLDEKKRRMDSHDAYVKQKALYDEQQIYKRQRREIAEFKRLQEEYDEYLRLSDFHKRSTQYRLDWNAYVERQQEYDSYHSKKKAYTDELQKYSDEVVRYTTEKTKYDAYLREKEAYEQYAAYDLYIKKYTQESNEYESAQHKYRIARELYQSDTEAYAEYMEDCRLVSINENMRQKYNLSVEQYESHYADMTKIYTAANRLTFLRKLKTYHQDKLNSEHNRKLYENSVIESNMLHHNMLTLLGVLKYRQHTIKADIETRVILEKQKEIILETLNQIKQKKAVCDHQEEQRLSQQILKAKLEKDKKAIDQRVDDLKSFIDIFAENSITMQSILRHFLNRVVHRMNELLKSHMIDLKVSTVNDNKQDEKYVNITMFSNNANVLISEASCGQKLIIDLAFRIAVIQLQPSPCVKLLIIDENLGHLDKDKLPKVMNMIEESGIPLMVISHSEEIKSNILDSIDIRKDEKDESHIEYGERRDISINGYHHIGDKTITAAKKKEKHPEENKVNTTPSEEIIIPTKTITVEPYESNDVPEDIRECFEVKNGVIVCKTCKNTSFTTVKNIIKHPTTQKHKNAVKAKSL